VWEVFDFHRLPEAFIFMAIFVDLELDSGEEIFKTQVFLKAVQTPANTLHQPRSFSG